MNVPEDLKQALELILKHKDRVIIEDQYGFRFEVAKAKVIGASTDDPGLVMKIKRLD